MMNRNDLERIENALNQMPPAIRARAVEAFRTEFPEIAWLTRNNGAISIDKANRYWPNMTRSSLDGERPGSRMPAR